MKTLMICLTILFTMAGPALAQQLEFVPFPETEIAIYDMTPDGSTLVGVNQTVAYDYEQLIWTEAGGIEYIGGFCYAGHINITDDGSMITGNARDLDGNAQAAIWQGGTDWQLLSGIGAVCDTTITTHYGTSGDASVLVGLGYDGCASAHPFRWDAGTGMVDLGSSVPDRNARANDISDDGQVIVGWQESDFGLWQGCYWDASGTQHILIDPETGEGTGDALKTNHDGSVIVGRGGGMLNDQAWYWTAATGVVLIGNLPGGWFPNTHAHDVSDDGSIIIGDNGEFFGNDAWIWTEATGIISISQYLTDNGATGHELMALDGAWRISGDGKTIIGWMRNMTFTYQAFMIRTVPQTVRVTATGMVEWNQVNFGVFADVNVGDPVTFSFEVNSEDYLNSSTYPTRGYVVDQDSFMVTAGSVQVPLANPYPNGEVPYFVLANDDPAADGFFIASNNVDWPWPGLKLDEAGVIGEPFEAHFDVGYEGDTIDSLDIVDAVGVYAYDGLTRFYFNIVDLGMEAIGIDFTQFEIGVVGRPW